MNYRIEALDELLNPDCALARYAPLFPRKRALIDALAAIGCRTKADCLALPDETLCAAGLPDAESAALFRRFLAQYDVKPAKLREIGTVCKTPEEARAFHELYQLPGVKATRASLYYQSGYRSLDDVAAASPKDIIARTEETIKRESLPFKPPLMKEVKTHIAVARAFTRYRAD